MTLDLHRFTGTHREIGRAYGTACRDQIALHLELVRRRLADSGIPVRDACAAASEYRPFVVAHAPFLDEEIAGVAEGAGLGLDEAYLLQLRAEVAADLQGSVDAEGECTTFALAPRITGDGVGLAGQNADLPEIYRRLMVVVDIAPDDGMRVLMAVPAGQVSYIGINERGMGVFANFLTCRGWVRGFPRYLLSRVALQHVRIADALEAVRRLPRASSRNLIMVDGRGDLADLENTPAEDAELQPDDGVLVHSNHYVSGELAHAEAASAPFLENSRIRLRRIGALIDGERGTIRPETMARILRDRAEAPHALSVEPGDVPVHVPEPQREVTVASVIAAPTEGRMWVAGGAPSRSKYVEYSFRSGRADHVAF